MHPALASSPGTPAPRRGAHAKPVTHPVPVTSTVGDVNVACSQGSPAPRLSQDRNHGLPGSTASVPCRMAQRGRASLRTPAVAGGQRTETTREEAPWLRSPNPQTGIAPRVPALLGHPQAEAPRSSPPGFSPFAPDRSCLQADRGHVPGCRADADADASTRSGFGGDGDGGGKRIPGHDLRASPALTQQRRTLRAQAGLPWQRHKARTACLPGRPLPP